VRKNWIRWLLIAVLVCGSAALVACGSDDSSSSSGSKSSGSSSSDSGKKKIRIGMVTDIGGLNDRGFNALAYKGLQQAKSQLGADIRVVTSKSNADYIPNLSSLARQKYDLVIAVGFLMGDATAKVAKSFPQTNFAIIDFPSAALKGKPQNVHGLLFKEAEAGYLVGTMAGLYAKDKGGKQVVSAIGGQKVPAVDAYAAGYQAGAAKANPGVKTPFAYSQDFVDQAKCKEIALNQIGQGSQVVFAAAGQCGLGALDAAKEKGVQSIGVDADQGYVNSNVMTSALKKVDVAVFQTAKDVQDGTFKEGTDTVFDVKSGGVGLGRVSKAGVKVLPEVKKVEADLAAGKITDIPTEPGK
jgi:basic membrane protein A and related proteins